MSKCMTIADESIDQKDTCREIAPKEIVELVLEEILLSALIISDKGCSRIGDFNITEDFCQQYDRHQYLKDFEQINYSGNPSATNQESNVNSGKSADRLASLVTAKENLESIIDSLVKKEDKTKPGGECTIISEEVLADNELQIQNGQSHIENNSSRGKSFPEAAAREYFNKKDVIRDEKIEIEYYNEGKLSKIYVPMIPSSRLDVETPLGLVQIQESRQEESEEGEIPPGQLSCQEDAERPFKPFTTEEFRQVWENINSSLVGRWDGDVSAKREEVGTLMEKLSSVQVFSDASVDPNRPRACAFAEEDVKKIIKEIEEISFTQSHANSEDFDTTYHPDGQGDADLESRSFARSKDSLEKAWEVDKPQEEVFAHVQPCKQDSSNDFRGEETEVYSSDKLLSDHSRQFFSEKSISGQSLQFLSEKMSTPEEHWTFSGTAISITDNDTLHSGNDATSAENLSKEQRALDEESLMESKYYSEISIKGDGSESAVLSPTFSADLPSERTSQMTESFAGASYSKSKEGIDDATDCLMMTAELGSECSAKAPPSWTTVDGIDENHTLKNFQLTSELDMSTSAKDIQDQNADINCSSQEIIIDLRLEPANREDDELKMDSLSGTKSEDSGADSHLLQLNSSSLLGMTRGEISVQQISEMAVNQENSKTVMNAEVSETAVNQENSKTDVNTEVSKTAVNTEVSKTAVNTEVSKTAVNTEVSKTAVNTEVSKTAVNTEVSKTAVDQENSKTDVNTEVSKTAVDQENSKTAVNTEVSKTAVDQENSKTDVNTEVSKTALDQENSKTDVDLEVSKSTVNDELEDACSPTEDTPGLENQLCDAGGELQDEKQTLKEGASLICDKSSESERWSQKSLNDPEESREEDSHPQPSSASLVPSQPEEDDTCSLTQNEILESSDVFPSTSQTFKLRSQKMYSGINHESEGQPQPECILTESEEAFIDETESVLQIIEPQEHSEDESSDKVSLSLLCEISHGESSSLADREQSESERSLKKNYSREFETPPKKVYSGMTTIGPMKNSDYDPKDLTAPSIDFGKMTRITSSRQLAKEIDMFGPEISSTASVKITEEDSGNDLTLTIEDDHIEFASLVNRDIASLTKVQKVREVMSHQPKPEDDFEDDDSLPRPRLDLKDVESMTDERYKVPDVSIPLLSLELGDNLGVEKELIENMSLLLGGLTNPVYYEEDLEDDTDDPDSHDNKSSLDKDTAHLVEFSVDQHDADKPASKTVITDTNEQISVTSVHIVDKREEYSRGSEDLLGAVGSTPSLQDNSSNSPKYSTLGSVFRKASSKLIRRDGDAFLRNSKSLPRETTKVSATDSIRSILDDCQSSASNMLKKSKSLLRNTQSIFKSMSSSRVSSDRDSGADAGKKKLSPSESDVSTLERKFCFLKKEDFIKAKNLIKSKVEKTLKNLDSGNSTSDDKVSTENKELRIVVRNEEKLRVDRVENFKKLLPKSPMVYKSQFVKSQLSVQENSAESEEAAEDSKTPDDEKVEPEEDKNDLVPSDETDSKEQTRPEIIIPLQESEQWSAEVEQLQSSASEASEPTQPDFIVMETIQGLPTSDLESPSSEKENTRTQTSEEVDRQSGNEDEKKTVASNSQEACADGANDVAPCFPELDEEKMATKTPSERKIKTKKKKLTARFRSFWCSAFGRVKTSPKKGDRS